MGAFALHRDRVVVAGFEGYGAQLNQNVFAGITKDLGERPLTDEQLRELERKVHRLGPRFVRIFFDPRALDHSTLMDSFQRTVALAQSAASTINVTWTGSGQEHPDRAMRAFADVLADRNHHGATKLRWVTIGNEPNRTKIKLDDYAALYRKLRRHLDERGLGRDRIGLMGGDLVVNHQQRWFDHLADHMRGVLDAWSIHVYWDYDQLAKGNKPAKLVDRLTGVRRLVSAKDKSKRKPLYVTEYGIRGTWKVERNVVGVSGAVKTKRVIVQPEPGIFHPHGPNLQGPRVVDLNINAFQHAWFNLLAANLGYRGLSKWDAYFGKYDIQDETHPQEYGMIGRPGASGWPLRPSYHLTRLFTQTVLPGSNVVEVAPAVAGSEIVAAYSGPSNELTLIGLDTAGASHNDPVHGQNRSYHFSKLPGNTSFQLLYWNRKGGGLLTSAGQVRTDGAGNLPVEAPLHSVFAVTTIHVDV